MSRLFALFFLFPVLALAAEPLATVHKMAAGRQLFVEISLPQQGKPTFLFLPGVNRALLLQEPAAQELIRGGYGVAAFHFSAQPLSIATLPAGMRPAFYDKDVTLASLAEEAMSVARGLESQYGLKRLIPVTLSYSGAVSLHLRGFPLVIDSVPLSSMAAFSPQLSMYYNWLKAGELMNPIFGPGITRASLDQAYRLQWVPQVEAIAAQFKLPAARKAEMVDGYLRLSRATEGFEWSNKADRTQRVFLLAAKESPTLLRHQVEVVRERLSQGRAESVFVVQESGHVIPSDQPAAYTQILIAVAEGRSQPGLTLVTPSSGEWKQLGTKDAVSYLERAVKGLPEAPAGRSNKAPEGRELPGTL